MNIGFMEAMKLEQFDCVIFHDVDLLPQNDRNMYTCPDESVRHMSAYIDKFNYKYVIYCLLIPGFETSNQTVASTDSPLTLSQTKLLPRGCHYHCMGTLPFDYDLVEKLIYFTL